MIDFSKAILEYADILAVYARKLTRDSEAAKDLTQDTLFKALSSSDKYDGANDMRPWLFTMMRNLFINSYQRRKLEKRLFIGDSSRLVRQVDPSTRASIANRIHLKEVQSVIDIMPKIFRLPIQLYCEGYKYREIAEITGASIETTKSRIYLGRQFLRRNVS